MQWINRFAPFISSIASAVALLIASYIVVNISRLQIDLADTRERYMLVQDGLAVERRLFWRLSDIESRIYRQKHQMEAAQKELADKPPVWLINEMKSFREIIEKTLDKISNLDVRLQRTEERLILHQKHSDGKN